MSDAPHLYQVEDGWCELGDGTAYYFGAEPEQLADMIEPKSISWALGRMCRYNGHTKRHYSVAEHTCVMADYHEKRGGSPQECLTILHHDDSEGLALPDLIRPVKHKMPAFKVLEDRQDKAVSIRFGTMFPFPAWLKDLDTRILKDERQQVMRPSKNKWGTDDLEALGVKLWWFRGRFAFWVSWEWRRRHNRWTRMIESQKSPAPTALVRNLDEYRGVNGNTPGK